MLAPSSELYRQAQEATYYVIAVVPVSINTLVLVHGTLAKFATGGEPLMLGLREPVDLVMAN